MRKPSYLWKTWSVSKLIRVMDCPRAFDLVYIRRAEAPENPYKVFGSAVHTLLEKFFKVNYQSAESFGKAGMGFWMGVVEGSHGPNSFSPDISKPVDIDFSKVKQPMMFLGMLKKILTTFYNDNLEYRDGPQPTPEVEKNFTLDLEGKKVRGIIDRIQPVAHGPDEHGVLRHHIWDYKPYVLDDFGMLLDMQLTMYNLWYVQQYGHDPASVGIYNYKGTFDDIVSAPPRDQQAFADLSLKFQEASEYIFGVLTGDLSRPATIMGFRHFIQDDLMTGMMTPKKVIGGPGCKFCEFKSDCLKLERGELPTTRDYAREKFTLPSAGRMLPFAVKHRGFDNPKSRANLRRTIAKRRVEPLPTKPEEVYLRLQLSVDKTSDKTDPTTYGRCPHCGYALGKNGKCGNCLSWYDADGNFLPRKSWRSISDRLRRKREQKDNALGGSPGARKDPEDSS